MSTTRLAVTILASFFLICMDYLLGIHWSLTQAAHDVIVATWGMVVYVCLTTTSKPSPPLATTEKSC